MSKRNYDELLTAGNKAQLEKLKDNEHKEGFNNIDLYYANERLSEEVEELEKELYNIAILEGTTQYFCKKKLNYKKIRHEAADVANFAHMIILACDKEIKKEG